MRRVIDLLAPEIPGPEIHLDVLMSWVWNYKCLYMYAMSGRLGWIVRLTRECLEQRGLADAAFSDDYQLRGPLTRRALTAGAKKCEYRVCAAGSDLWWRTDGR